MVTGQRADSCHWIEGVGRGQAVVTGLKVWVVGRAALVWMLCLQFPGVTRQSLAGFPLADPTKMLHIPTSLSPLGPLSGFRLRSQGPGIP